VDDIERLLRRKALELAGRGGGARCCVVSYAPGHVITSEAQFKNAVMGCRVALLMFFGRLCPLCHAFEPVFRQVGEMYRGMANFVRADIEEFYYLADALGVAGTPSVAVFIDGRPVDVVPGPVGASQLRSLVESALRHAGCLKG
jgi:thioredoxin-like negative regulator of GroEL